jgi:hypothetical protein
MKVVEVVHESAEEKRVAHSLADHGGARKGEVER